MRVELHGSKKKIVSGGEGGHDKEIFRAAKYSKIAKAVFQKVGWTHAPSPPGSYGTELKAVLKYYVDSVFSFVRREGGAVDKSITLVNYLIDTG